MALNAAYLLGFLAVLKSILACAFEGFDGAVGEFVFLALLFFLLSGLCDGRGEAFLFGNRQIGVFVGREASEESCKLLAFQSEALADGLQFIL